MNGEKLFNQKTTSHTYISDSMPIGKKITLHRMNTEGIHVKKNNQIRKILDSLKVKMQKKQEAQQRYYENTTSPLLKDIIEKNKLPVHQRLGNQGRKKIAYNFNPHIKNKRLQGNTRNQRKKNFAQTRIQRIQQRRVAENVLNNSNLITKFRSRRHMSLPINYKILFKNDTPYNGNEFKIHSVLGSLNPELQEEIRIIQTQNSVEPNVIPNIPIITVGYGFTGKSMDNRFSSLF